MCLMGVDGGGTGRIPRRVAKEAFTFARQRAVWDRDVPPGEVGAGW